MLGGKNKQRRYKILCTVAYKIVLFCTHIYIYIYAYIMYWKSQIK